MVSVAPRNVGGYSYGVNMSTSTDPLFADPLVTGALATDPLVTAAVAFAAMWAGALGFAAGSGTATGGLRDAGVDVAGMSDSGLLRAAEAGFAVGRQADALLARIAGEVEERSRPSLGAEGLAKRTGNRTAAVLLTERGRITLAEASRLVRVGAATAQPVTLHGPRMPVRYPAVAEAVAAGLIPVDSAEVILANLDQARANADPSDLIVAEKALVDFAADSPADLVRKLAIATRDRLDTDGIEPREQRLVAQRGWQRINRRDGMIRYVFDADPLSAGYVDAWMDAHIGAALRKPRFEQAHPAEHDRAADGCDDHHEELAEPRTIGQLGADAIVDLLRHGLSCPASMGPAATTTMVVRIDLEALLTGLGRAQIDGIEQPISAGTARRLAAEAELIPMVLGGNSEVLDLGVSRRLFSKAQRLGLGERDDGCAWAGCTRPPSYTEAHHITWWKSQGGRTDLLNGILLCSADHHRIHQGGWDITVIDNVPWFIPPATIDITRTPRRGGRLQLPRPSK